MKKYSILIAGLIFIAGAAVAYWSFTKGGSSNNNLPVACTMEAKLCPDGSAVGRSGPLCEFAECPSSPTPTITPTPSATSNVTLGVGKTGTAGGLTITLDSIVQDSRCAEDVQCVWAGLVEAKVMLKTGSKSETVNITSTQAPHKFDGYSISISSVTPLRTTMGQITTDQFRVTFHVVK